MARGARSTPLKAGPSGRLTSARSKTGDPQCSAAMSLWVRARKTGSAVAGEVFKILAGCRAKARAQGLSRDHATAGNELKSQVWAKRAERGMSGAERNRASEHKREMLGFRRLEREKRAEAAAKARELLGPGREEHARMVEARKAARAAAKNQARSAAADERPVRVIADRADTADRNFRRRENQGWGRGMQSQGDERRQAASEIRALRRAALAKVAAWKASGVPPGTDEQLAKGRQAAGDAVRAARHAGENARAKAVKEGRLRVIQLMQREASKPPAAAVARASGRNTPERARRAAELRASRRRPAAKPTEGFRLKQESTVGKKAFQTEDAGRGKTGFMFDMKKGDKLGQTSLLDRVGTAQSNPRGSRYSRLGAPLEIHDELASVRARRAAELKGNRNEARARAGSRGGGGDAHEARILETFRRHGDLKNNHATIAEIREKTGLPREHFDAAFRGLLRKGHITADPLESLAGMKPGEGKRLNDQGVPGAGTDKPYARMGITEKAPEPAKPPMKKKPRRGS